MTDLTPTLTAKLHEAFAPEHLEVLNESHNHSRPGNNTHFKVLVVTRHFQGKRLIQRHQLLYQLFDAELKAGVHALTLHTFTPEEWQQRHQEVADSPSCRGGSKAELS